MTINEKQAIINNKVEELHNKFRERRKGLWPEVPHPERLRSCTAYVYKYSDGYIVLRSYNTFVAFITPDGDFVDILRLVYGYTATSAQHIGKFYHDYAGNCKNYYTYRPIKK